MDFFWRMGFWQATLTFRDAFKQQEKSKFCVILITLAPVFSFKSEVSIFWTNAFLVSKGYLQRRVSSRKNLVSSAISLFASTDFFGIKRFCKQRSLLEPRLGSHTKFGSSAILIKFAPLFDSLFSLYILKLLLAPDGNFQIFRQNALLASNFHFLTQV